MTSANQPPKNQTINPYRELPSVSALLEHFTDRSFAAELLTQVIREELTIARQDIQEGKRLSVDDVIERCQVALAEIEATRFDSVINGTGIVLHTNLGRAPVSHETAAAMAASAGSYLSLEIDPDTNRRGGRMDEISRLMRVLTGAQSTLVVNNNAGAILLSLAALSAGREVVVSRGEAVEIGGGVRIPEVVQQSGCRLVEVGTTNRTYLKDFQNAAGPDTSALLKVHTSNFRVEGFTAGVTTGELGGLARSLDLLLLEDLGSGALLDTSRFGLSHEPTVAEVISAGASIVTLSGDKLLGGPQAGIIAGRRDLIGRIERHPLARALRTDKVTLAGVAATLRHYLRGEAETEIPIWSMIGATIEQLTGRAATVADLVGAQAVPSIASVGGGSLPGETLPSVALSFSSSHPDVFARALRTGSPRVFPIIRDDAVLIDLRTVRPEQDVPLADALASALALLS
ncbi:MAG TPA: L-seryl-tRNA(Sec) selenium transferase [Thermomicrobiales bacterium]|nr:L-seryl-tRNA(Sec) selenium transferase [Thermomicrobiales bacterium]